MTTAAEQLAPSCFEQLTSFNLELGQVTHFDQMHGMVLLTEGSTCWNQVREGFQAAADFVEEQLKLAADAGLGEDAGAVAEEVTESLTAATEEATGITAIIDQINKYTDAQMLISMYSWDPEDVIDGEGVGVCHQPTNIAENYASCWEWKKDVEGAFESQPTSYLIDPASLTAEASLEQQAPIATVNIPAMFGNWICSRPMEMAYRMRTTCARLMPRDQTLEDPTYTIDDPVTVMTYFSSRFSGRTSTPEAVNGNEGFRAHNSAFETFSVSLEESMGINLFEGAVSTYTSSAIGMVAAIAAFAF